MKKLLNETIIYGIGAIMPRIIVVLLNYLFIKNINNEDFAIFTNLYALISFVNIVLSFGFETAYFRFSSNKDNEQKVFNTSFWFLTGLSTVFLALVLLFNQPIADIFGYSQTPEFIRWFAWIAFFDNILVIPLAWFRFNNRPIKYTAVRVIQAVFQSVLAISLFLYIPQELSLKLGLKEKVSYPFYSNLAASALGVLLVMPVILKIRFQFSKALFLQMIRYSWPIMIAGLAFMVNENFDKFIQKFIIDAGDAGAYGGCYKMAVLMTLFVTAYRMGIEPFFFKQMQSENAKLTYAKVTEYFSFFASVVALGIIANVSWIKLLLVPNSSYWVALNIIPVIVIANLFFGIYYNLSTWYKVTDRTRIGTYISWTGAIITIILNLIFLKEYGFMVSAWITLAAYFLMMILSYWLGQKYYPIPYRMKKVSFFIILLAIFSYVIVGFFDYNLWIGNFLFLVYTAVLIYSEKGMLLSKIRR
ncbi:oligosaccharide flippase family protein [Chryseobacterium sp. JJR-5R]|uniref:lipopolysaccharide biosynthesis protein n=1 Tax=Chryseobacterium sp. JJR-5R TaxID=3093923 RepID=UPI002A752AE6|nr:oligosaccharide flippase family protein [Chryseobacterium sp. JJR-5R]WPO83241.1 oligosaccharide flippase family protein [Chryseobacterium sp. JJR-5R]